MNHLKNMLQQNEERIASVNNNMDQVTQTINEMRHQKMSMISEICKLEKVNSDIAMQITLENCYNTSDQVSKEEVDVIIQGLDKCEFVQQYMNNKNRIKLFVDFDVVIAEISRIKIKYPNWTLYKVTRTAFKDDANSNNTYCYSFVTQDDEYFTFTKNL